MSVNNISKLLQYIEPLALNPISIDGIQYNNQAKSIKLNKNFLLGDSCDMCGKCCINEANIFTESEYEKIIGMQEYNYNELGLNYENHINLIKCIKPINHNINGNNITLYKVDKQHNFMDIPDRGYIDRCRFLVKKSDTMFVCGIHPVSSVTCDMPHLRFYFNRKTLNLSIGVGEYGRNWALKCPVKFGSDIIDYKLSKLNHLNQVCLDLGIETHLPKIIDYISGITINNFESKLDINILDVNKRRLF